jgi:valyl-tRNA synthetase
MNNDATKNAKPVISMLDRYEFLKQLLEDNKNKGLFVKVEKIIHSVGHSERTEASSNHILAQRFIKMLPLADRALQERESIHPEEISEDFPHWKENAERLVTSLRQLWWGQPDSRLLTQRTARKYFPLTGTPPDV